MQGLFGWVLDPNDNEMGFIVLDIINIPFKFSFDICVSSRGKVNHVPFARDDEHRLKELYERFGIQGLIGIIVKPIMYTYKFRVF